MTTSSASSLPPSHSSSLPPRPKFTSKALPISPCELATPDDQGWINVVESPAYFPLPLFTRILAELCHHPERNSGLILRADILSTDTSSFTTSQPTATTSFTPPPHYSLIFHLRRRLLPRRPAIDGPLDQSCYFFTSEPTFTDGVSAQKKGLVVLVPEAETEEGIPYYHPKVRKLAYHYVEAPKKTIKSVFDDADDDDEEVKGSARRDGGSTAPTAQQFGTVSISILPFSSPACPASTSDSTATPPTADEILPNRTYRTCLHLLETLHKHAFGSLVGYQKRVVHDVVVERTSFQDLYLVLKERHKHLDSQVQKKGSNKLLDVKRHVWKDVAVATFLMLLWRDMYPPVPAEDREGDQPTVGEEWDAWGRPPGGFVDLGCGNGLLVHILTSEGYSGKGIELRSRKTWPTYPESTQAVLLESAVNPTEWFPSTLEEWDQGEWDGRDKCPLAEGGFLIGNHADEMTPWIPLLSLIPRTPTPFLSLPCCLHTLTSSFTQLTFRPPHHPSSPHGGFDAGFEAGESRYKAYLMWLGWQGLMCGWEWEKEGLRVPSTRSWGIVGRKRWTKTPDEDRACREWVLGQVNLARQVGFVVREKEGNPH